MTKFVFVLMLLAADLLMASNSMVELSAISCDQNIRTTTGILILKNNKNYVITADLTVDSSIAMKNCLTGTHQEKKLELRLVSTDPRQGLSLYEVTNSPTIEVQHTSVKSISSALSAQFFKDGQLKNLHIDVLQTRSQRSFFPNSQLVIEGRADADYAALGGIVENASGETVGVVSRYQLVFEAGSITRVHRAFTQAQYAAVIILPWSNIEKWVDQTLLTSEHLKWSISLKEKFNYEVSVGPFRFSEDCSYAQYPKVKPSPIGGFDGFGIGGTDVNEVGGLNKLASVCAIKIEITDSTESAPAWMKAISDRHPVGSVLRVAGVMKLHSETKEWILLSAFSLDHFFQMAETPGYKPFFQWETKPKNQRSIEVSGWNLHTDFHFLIGRHLELNAENVREAPMHMYIANKIRLYSLLLSSTFPEDLPKAQWDRMRNNPSSEDESSAFHYVARPWDPNVMELIKRLDTWWIEVGQSE